MSRIKQIGVLGFKPNKNYEKSTFSRDDNRLYFPKPVNVTRETRIESLHLDIIESGTRISITAVNLLRNQRGV